MAGKLSAREIAHVALRQSGVWCVVHDHAAEDDHAEECDQATAAIQAHEDAVREEALEALDRELRVAQGVLNDKELDDDQFAIVEEFADRVLRALRTRAATKDGQG